jgi:hypothetical protein
VIARGATPGSPAPPEVLRLLDEFLAIDRERCERESRCLEALAEQGDTPRSIQ